MNNIGLRIEVAKFITFCTTFKDAWSNCKHGANMLRLAQRVGVDNKTLTLAKALCANTIRHLLTDELYLKAIDTALSFGQGINTEQELRDINKLVYYAYIKTDESYTNDIDADIAYIMYITTSLDNDACDVATYTSYITSQSEANINDTTSNHLLTANICREVLTEEIMKIITI